MAATFMTLTSVTDIDLSPIIIAVMVLVELVGIGFAIDAVMRNRTPQGTIAWAIALVLMPAVSIPFYIVFGNRRFDAYVRAVRKEHAGLHALWQQARAGVEPFAVHANGGGGLCPALERLTALPATRANDVTLLVDGQATFDSVIAAIDAAQRYVLSQFYIVRNDGIGARYRDALLRARARGVMVLFLYDEIGSLELDPAYLQPLIDAGCEVSECNTARHGNRFQLNFRNHRKTVVVDGLVAFTGGLNVGDEYLGLDPEMRPWRDTHIRLEGPGALAVQLAWCEDWQWATRRVPALNWVPRAVAGGGRDQVIVLPSGPADPLETCTLMFMHLIQGATRRLWIASPYFVPDEGIIAALQLAASRGVDVRLVLPGRSDNILVWMSEYSFLPDVIPAGVKVYRYAKGFMHHKVLLCDDTAAVGTANLDNRSFRINFEITVLAEGAIGGAVETMMQRDFERCHGVSLAEFQRRSWWFRVAARVARLMSPIQ